MIIKKILIVLLSSVIPVLASELENEEARSNMSPQGASLTLIGESHAEPAGTKLVYRLMHRASELGKSVNFMYERDEERIRWAKEELNILLSHNPNLLDNNFTDYLENNHFDYINFLKEHNKKLSDDIYGSWKSEEFNGKIKNRFWFLRILKDFPDQIIPIDANFDMVTKYYSKNENNPDFLWNDKRYFEYYCQQNNIPKAMSNNIGCHIRNILTMENIRSKIAENAINVTLVGLVHAGYIHENCQIPMLKLRTLIKDQDLKTESYQTGVTAFYSNAMTIEDKEETIISQLLK